MISALAGRDHIEEGLNSGANAYMVKPFDVDEVLSRMEFLLGEPEIQR
jgi:DNA-binding response OmpR family regulator